MRKISIVFALAMSLGACTNGPEKPEKFIDEDKMISILYDVAVIDAIKSYSLNTTHDYSVNTYVYIQKKYQVDSLQFAQNNHYYAADMVRYKKMFEKVNQLLEAEKKKYEAAVLKAGDQKSKAN
ncbi:MAG: DUF4296 domain-containing protein [Flavobacterium sp.]|jgi:hypothetical protein|nr:DUF4296 domain-containing protein [Flavobacterium sp.]